MKGQVHRSAASSSWCLASAVGRRRGTELVGHRPTGSSGHGSSGTERSWPIAAECRGVAGIRAAEVLPAPLAALEHRMAGCRRRGSAADYLGAGGGGSCRPAWRAAPGHPAPRSAEPDLLCGAAGQRASGSSRVHRRPAPRPYLRRSVPPSSVSSTGGSRMKNCNILRDCWQRGDSLHHAVQAVARMHHLAPSPLDQARQMPSSACLTTAFYNTLIVQSRGCPGRSSHRDLGHLTMFCVSLRWLAWSVCTPGSSDGCFQRRVVSAGCLGQG